MPLPLLTTKCGVRKKKQINVLMSVEEHRIKQEKGMTNNYVQNPKQTAHYRECRSAETTERNVDV